MDFKPDPRFASCSSLVEQLTWNFYAWERLGRGWVRWGYPVPLEPPFQPFRHCAIPREIEDDGRRPSFFSRLAGFPGRLLGTGKSGAGTGQMHDPWSEVEPDSHSPDDDTRTLTLSMPAGMRVGLETAELLLLSLACCADQIGFEVVGTTSTVSFNLTCVGNDMHHATQQLLAHFPDCAVEEVDYDPMRAWGPGDLGMIVDFGLSQEFMRPLRAFGSLDPDPLAGIVGSLSGLRPGETGIYQVLFRAVRNSWADSVTRSVLDGGGRPFFADSDDMVRLASEKVSRQLYAVALRVAGRGETELDGIRIARSLAGGLVPFARPGSNSLLPLDNAGYDDKLHTGDMYFRQSRRYGMILNSLELASLVHLPSASIRSGKLLRQLRRTKAAPEITRGHELVIGDNVHKGKRTEVSLSTKQRLRHAHVIGATGTGKTTFILNLIVQDMENGNGVAVLDPHGDLTDMVMERVPEDRINDVVLIDPSDIDHPVGFNPLAAHSELEKIAISSDFVEVFKRLSTSWGDQMTSVLGNVVLAFLESDVGGTLADMRRFLIEKDFRQNFLKTVKDPEVVYFWEKGFQMLVGRPQGPILTRLDTFLRPKTIRRMVSQRKGLNFREIMDGRKILLAKLSQGLIGTENAYLLGTLIVSKMHQIAMARQVQHSSERVNFFVYIDEFHNFLTKSMADLLSGARKYNLGLVLAHQDLRQLWERDKEVANSVISNPGTRICFRVGDYDARKLEDGFSSFDSMDLQNLGVGEAIARVDRAENNFNLNTYPDPEVDPGHAADRRQRIIEHSRLKHAAQVHPEAGKLSMVDETPVPIEKPVRDLVEIKQDVRESMPEVSAIPGIAEKDLEGSGGSEHRYLQTLIKKLAENLGFRAVIEEQTPNRKGKVDIGLEMSGRRIACEISLTSKHSHEMGNIRKCLDAGYDRVIVCSQDKKSLSGLKKTANEKFNPSDQSKLSFLLPQELIFHLEQEAASIAGSDQRVKGWNVKVNYQTVSDDEKVAKRESINKVILQAFQRLRKDN